MSKCNVLRMGRNCVLGDCTFNCYVLCRVYQAVDLGLTVNKSFSFSGYINEWSSEAFSRSLLILKVFHLVTLSS